MASPTSAQEARIAQLSFRVATNPDSPLFLPLANVHRQAGRLEDAVKVLRAGLERHPSHFSARAALGRVLVELGRLNEARDELEQVLAGAPDNLLARRLLQDVAPDVVPPAQPPPPPARAAPEAADPAERSMPEPVAVPQEQGSLPTPPEPPEAPLQVEEAVPSPTPVADRQDPRVIALRRFLDAAVRVGGQHA
jgi:tetratricopeptide (TPR) repeat protein